MCYAHAESLLLDLPWQLYVRVCEASVEMLQPTHTFATETCMEHWHGIQYAHFDQHAEIVGLRLVFPHANQSEHIVRHASVAHKSLL